MNKAEVKPRKIRGSNKIDMCEGAILPLIIRFAIPLLITGILQVLFNAADIMVVGKFGSDHSLAAVSSTGSITALIVNLFIGLSVGTNVLCARFFGARDGKALSETIHTSMVVAVIIGAVLTFVGIVSSAPLLRMMAVPDEVLPLAALYMQIYFVGMIPSLVYNFASAVLRSVGDTKRPMYFLTLAGVINVLLNLLLVIVFRLDVAGVAIATIVSQTVSAVLCVICLFRESDDVKLCIDKLKITKQRLVQIIRVGLPAGLQSTMFSIANVVVQSSLNPFGAAVIAGSGAAGSIESLLFTALDSIYQAIVSFTGQNFGQRSYKRILRAQFWGQVIVYTFGLALCVLAVVFAHPLISLYADKPDEIAAGVDRLRVLGISVFIFASSNVAVATIRGLGYSLTPMITSLICVCGARLLWIATIFKLPQFHTVSGLYAAFPVSYILSLVVQSVCLVFVYRNAVKRYPPMDL